MSNLYLYFSGTGNTKFVINEFAKRFEESDYLIHSIEDDIIDFPLLIKNSDIITIGYPIYGSDMPLVMKAFIKNNQDNFRGKKIMTITTQYMFSGDGAALACYMLRKQKVRILATMQINMPYNATDAPIFPIKSVEESENVYQKASLKIAKYVENIKAGKRVRTGRRIYSWFLGFFIQRLFYKMFFKRWQKLVKIDYDTCINCKKCVDNCPTNNLVFEDDKVLSGTSCALCYRCVNICPTKSIRIFGKKYPKQQYFK